MRKPVLSAEYQVPGEERETQRSALRTQHSLKGFTLIELLLVIIIIVVLVGTLITRVTYYQEQAEKTAMEQVAGALQSALLLQYFKLLTRGQEAEVKTLGGENPVHWLQRMPNKYAGEFDDPTPTTIHSGWMFDLKSHDLIYVPDRSEYFIPGKDGKKWIRFHIIFGYEAFKGDTHKGGHEMVSMLFEPTEPYHWFE
jgi:prepilin-type N-terminal cleavage/methylation domain-containing protein